MSDIAYFSTVTDDPDMKAILDQVEGATGAYALEIVAGRWLVGCLSFDREAEDFDRDCQQAIRDAERVRELLRGVDLEW